MEFENLINFQGRGTLRRAPIEPNTGLWNGFASLFRSPTLSGSTRPRSSGYQSIPSYDTARYQERSPSLPTPQQLLDPEPSAELLTQEEVSRITAGVATERPITPILAIQKEPPKNIFNPTGQSLRVWTFF